MKFTRDHDDIRGFETWSMEVCRANQEMVIMNWIETVKSVCLNFILYDKGYVIWYGYSIGARRESKKDAQGIWLFSEKEAISLRKKSFHDAICSLSWLRLKSHFTSLGRARRQKSSVNLAGRICYQHRGSLICQNVQLGTEDILSMQRYFVGTLSLFHHWSQLRSCSEHNCAKLDFF